MAQQTYGIELEMFNITPAQVAEAIEGIDGAEYGGHFGYHQSRRLGTRHARMDGSPIVWASESDSSLYGLTNSMEGVSPILHGRKGLAHAARIMKALVKAGASANSRKCGTHLTMGVRNCNARFTRMGAAAQARVAGRIYEAYAWFYDAICEFVSESRRNAGYSEAPMSTTSVPFKFGIGTKDHYQANLNRMGHRNDCVNMTKFVTEGVLEFRQHNGTLDGAKITNWALLMHKIVSWAITTKPVDLRNYNPNVEGLFNCMNVGSDLGAALLARAEQTPAVTPHRRNQRVLLRAMMNEDYQMTDTQESA